MTILRLELRGWWIEARLRVARWLLEGYARTLEESVDLLRYRVILMGCAGPVRIIMPHTPNPDVPMFFTGDVCRAANVEPVNLKNWIMRGVILMSDEDRERYKHLEIEPQSYERLATGSGRSHLFTLRRVIQVALVAELTRLGVPPAKAGMLALGFTDVGKGGAGYAGEIPTIKRFPGQLFRSGMTVLVAYSDKDTSTVINVDEETPLFEILASGAAAIVINVNEVCRRTCAALDVDYPV
ncbi:hypothetical protein ACFQU7_10825 [Pseudoroseomonas wenyumeiae]